MRYKTSTIFGIIGLLAGFAYTIYRIWNFVLDVNAVRSVEYVNEEIFPNFQLYTTVGLLWSFLFILIALVVSIISLIYIIKINRKPYKNGYKVLIITNAIGLITPFFVGSIILLIDGIIGIKKLKHD